MKSIAVFLTVAFAALALCLDGDVAEVQAGSLPQLFDGATDLTGVSAMKSNLVAKARAGQNNRGADSCATGLESEFICPPDAPDANNVVLPDPYSCTGYIICVHGRPYCFSCPQGTQFDVVKGDCDLEANVQCYIIPVETEAPQEGGRSNYYKTIEF